MSAAPHTPSRLRVVVAGLLAQHARLGGMTWHYLHYLIGLRQLGHDVLYLEDSGQWPYVVDGAVEGDATAYDCTPNVAYLAGVMARFGLADRWAYRFPVTGAWFGVAGAARDAFVRTADLVLNVSGTLEHPERYRGAGRLVYLDTDPVFTQIQIALAEDAESVARVAAHDVHATFAAHPALLPPTPYEWLVTRQPVALSEWAPRDGGRAAFTTVMNWKSYKSLVYRGEAYEHKHVEFVRFLDLPSRVAPPMEVAVPVIHERDWRQTDLLAPAGWARVNAFAACGNLDRYRDYVRTSRAEWTVAKNLYVRGQVGWFSERSACYLAAGRPVVTQDTGLAGALPTGEGLLAFRTLDEAAAAVEAVDRDYARHARAARELAEAYFDAPAVLAALIDGVAAR